MLTEVGLLVHIVLFFQLVWKFEDFQDIQLGKSFVFFFLFPDQKNL